MTTLTGPQIELRRTHGITGAGRVKRILTTNSVGETSTTDFSEDGTRAVHVYPDGLTFYEWTTPRSLFGSYTSPEKVIPRTHLREQQFDVQGRWIRTVEGVTGKKKEVVTRRYESDHLLSAVMYEQISDQAFAYLTYTYEDLPPEPGRGRREKVTITARRVATTVMLVEYDSGEREIYSESRTKGHKGVNRTTNTYTDDSHGNWVTMEIESVNVAFNPPRHVYLHTRQIAYWPD